MSDLATTEHVMPEADAHRLTERIRYAAMSVRDGVEKLQQLVSAAQEGNAHLSLGYASWTAYIADVMGDEPLHLPRDKRREVVAWLSGEGMSTRAIAPIVGTTKSSIGRDLQVSRTGTPEPATPIFADGSPEIVKLTGPNSVHSPGLAVDLANVDMETGEIHDEPVHKVTGMDGKTYTRPEPAKPRRRPLPDAIFSAVYDLGKNVERLVRLIEDDRFPQNREQVALRHENDLNRTADALAGVLRAVNNQ